MNKEEIDNLENYLKNKLPKIEPTIPITNFGDIDLDDLMNSIKQFKKVPTSDELLRENKRLREQLEEKDKVIDKKNKCLLEIAKETMEMVKWLESKGMSFDNEGWIKELERMLEEGKNEK